jgi:hypothetical protein
MKIFKAYNLTPLKKGKESKNKIKSKISYAIILTLH